MYHILSLHSSHSVIYFAVLRRKFEWLHGNMDKAKHRPRLLQTAWQWQKGQNRTTDVISNNLSSL